MSGHNILKSIAVIAIGGICGYSAVHHLKPQPKHRFLASQPMISKVGQEQNARYLFDVQLNTDGLAQQDSGVSTVKVKITALRAIDAGLIYTWNLSDGVQVVEGSVHDQLGAFSSGEYKEFTLRVRGFSKENRKYLSFEVRGEVAQRNVRREVLISSRIEDSFEYVIQQNQLQQNQLNGKPGAQSINNRFKPENVIK